MILPVSLNPELIYLNHAAVAPWPHHTVEAVTRFAQENGWQGAQEYPRWLTVEQALRDSLAQLINAPSSEDIALLKSTSEGLSLVAAGLGWQAGDSVVGIAQEFPSNRIPWQALRSQGVEMRLLDLKTAADPETGLLALCDERTRLVSVSSVQYATGLRLDLNRLGRACRERGILFCVDAIQSLGAVPFDVQACGADFVVADGHKWMLGPEGVALFYVKAGLREKLSLQQYGWHMVEQVGQYDRAEWEPARNARRFECGSPNMLGIHALAASLELIHDNGIGQVAQSVQANADAVIAEVDRRGFELLTPRAAQRRAGIVTFNVPGRESQTLYDGLMSRGVICACRGGGIRFSPHFYNTPEEIGQAFERLDTLLATS